MKLRIKGALRLRLTQGEIRALAEQGLVEERVPFAAGVHLVYRLRRDPAARAIERPTRDVLEVRVPESTAREWCTSELVTLAHEQPLPEGALRIVLEKDYACLAPRTDEDESDNYPAPGGRGGRELLARAPVAAPRAPAGLPACRHRRRRSASARAPRDRRCVAAVRAPRHRRAVPPARGRRCAGRWPAPRWCRHRAPRRCTEGCLRQVPARRSRSSAVTAA